MIDFEWTMKFGDILTIAGAVFVGGTILYKRGGHEATQVARGASMQVTLEALTRELTEMKTEFKTFGATLTKVAIQEGQIALLMKWYDELRHGDGYVKGHPRKGVDGEYP